MFGIDDLVAGVIGGVINLGVNIWQGNIHNIGQGLAAFGAGAAAGALATWGPAGWAAGGAIVGGTNAWLSGKNPVSGILTGAVTGLIGGQLGQWASGGIGGVVVNNVKITSPLLQGTIIGSLSGGATGGAISFGTALIGGANINDAFKAAGQGFSMGLVTGGIAGASASYANSVKNGVNPFNGTRLNKFGESPIAQFDPAKVDLSHAFSRPDRFAGILGGDQAKITTEVVNNIQQIQPMLIEGSNTILTNIAGQPITIRCFVQSGQVISTNIFTNDSSRVLGNLINLR